MKVRTLQELMTNNLIVKHLAGSHAYGTNLPTSDVDYRGIFCADPVHVRTPFFTIREATDTSEEDTKFYELSNFMKLCLDCNPNVIETLWVDEKDVVHTTDAYKVLRTHREALLSKKVAFTFSGYAMAQLKRIKGHNKWINQPQSEQPPKPSDFLTVVQWFGPEINFWTISPEKNLHPDLSRYRENHRFVPYGNNLFGVHEAPLYCLWNTDGDLNINFQENRENFREPLMFVKWNKEEYVSAKEKWNNYWTWKKNRNKTRSELEEKYGFDCYTDDTEFLTDSGWKRFDDVTEQDKIATFNQQTHKVEYQTPVERIDSIYTGNLYNLTGYHVDTNVSSNHWMYIRKHSRTTDTTTGWQLVRVAELPETFDTLNVVVSPQINRQKLSKGINETIFKHVHLLDYLRLIGWYISDGTMNFYPNGKVKSMTITQSKPQSRLTQTLTKQINYKKINCNEYVYEARGIANYPERKWIFNSELSQIIYDDCGHKSENKRLPSWCFLLTKREMTTLLVALLQGDGSKRNHQAHTYVYYTINSMLADDVQRLALLCGFETSKYGPYNMDSTFQTESKMYQVHINMRPIKYRRHVRSASVQKTFVQNQRIVCFMVKNHTLITRRNGQIGLHGNSKHAMHLVRLMRMGVEILRDHQVLVKRPDAEELLAIRNGAWSYDDLIKYTESMDKEVREVWYQKSTLPKTPDVHLAAVLTMNIQNIVWDTEED